MERDEEVTPLASRLQLKLTGDNARLGELYASDIARLIDGVERAIGRAAAQLVGRAPGTPGRLPNAAANAARLRLADIGEGSLVLQFEPPAAPSIPETSEQGLLDLDDSDLGESAVRVVMDVLSGSETGFTEAAAALSQLAEDLDIGERYDALAFSQPGEMPHEAVLDRSARERLSAVAQRRTRHDDEGTLVGILYEADFEKSSAHLRTPLGSSVTVHFGDDYAQAIKEALRESSQLQGRITYNVATSAIVSVDLTDIALTEQLVVPSIGEFWATKSLEELAEAQGVGVVESIEALRDDTISDEEADAFIAALAL
ncbi:MAG: hypothetical protein OXL98_11895 [Acidimicrobiaceae bacterium]|nr:hypothetical protein [Acidimicrobiaceae bacterium]